MTPDGHSEEKYVTGTLKRSSAQLGWNSVLAETWQHKAGRLPNIKPRDTEIAILLSGRAKVRRKGDGDTQICDAISGTIWLCPAGIEERNIRIYDNLDSVLHIFLPPSPLDSAYEPEIGAARLRYDGGFHDEFIRQLGMAIHEEMTRPSALSALRVDSIGACLSAHLVSKYSSLKAPQAESTTAVGALDKRRLDRVVEFIDAHLAERISLDELATVSCLSRHHFARAFKKATGQTPHRFIVDRKLEHSKHLLQDASISLSEAALCAGFANQAHFSRVFKQHTGVSPGEFRRRH